MFQLTSYVVPRSMMRSSFHRLLTTSISGAGAGIGNVSVECVSVKTRGEKNEIHVFVLSIPAYQIMCMIKLCLL